MKHAVRHVSIGGAAFKMVETINDGDAKTIEAMASITNSLNKMNMLKKAMVNNENFVDHEYYMLAENVIANLGKTK